MKGYTYPRTSIRIFFLIRVYKRIFNHPDRNKIWKVKDFMPGYDTMSIRSALYLLEHLGMLECVNTEYKYSDRRYKKLTSQTKSFRIKRRR